LPMAILIIAGIRFRKVLRRGGHHDDSKTQVLRNFGAHVRVTEKDVLKTIDDPKGDNVIGGGARSTVYSGVHTMAKVFALK
jgi:hypothetical protein